MINIKIIIIIVVIKSSDYGAAAVAIMKTVRGLSKLALVRKTSASDPFQLNWSIGDESN